VVGVSWWEAEAFCKWAGGFLPTELHWEAAARGPRGLVYPWGDEREDVICNSYEAELCSPSVVGVFPRDRTDCTGVMDMAGNVLEWCQDVEASGRVIRGGCWGLHARICRAADRGRIEPQARASYLGFRVAAVPPGGRQQEQGVR
jgi:formylglycine-generating enzyme required for sulfatase activity